MPEGMITVDKSFTILNIASPLLAQSILLGSRFSFATLYLLFH